MTPRDFIAHIGISDGLEMGAADPAGDIERMSREEIGELQRMALVRLFNLLRTKSPFYRTKVARTPYDPFRMSDALFTTREDLVTAQSADQPWGGLLAVPPHAISIMGFTNAMASGLDGYPDLLLAATEGDMRQRVDVAFRAFSAGGASPDDRTAIIGEVARSILHHAILGGLVATGSTPFQTGRALTLRHVRHTLPFLTPTQLVTHPTYALYLAELLDQEDVRLPVKRLFLWGEVGPSVPSAAQVIEEAWGYPTIRDIYEVIDPLTRKVLGPGERGELVITALHAEAMPLVRYRTGDLVIVDDERCSCGRTHLRLQVLGKVAEGPWGRLSVNLTIIENILSRVGPLRGNYRVALEDSGPVLEVCPRTDSEIEAAAALNAAMLAAKSAGTELRIVENLPRFHHRARRVVGPNDKDLWNIQVEEQRRLEE